MPHTQGMGGSYSTIGREESKEIWKKRKWMRKITVFLCVLAARGWALACYFFSFGADNHIACASKWISRGGLWVGPSLEIRPFVGVEYGVTTHWNDVFMTIRPSSIPESGFCFKASCGMTCPYKSVAGECWKAIVTSNFIEGVELLVHSKHRGRSYKILY